MKQFALGELVTWWDLVGPVERNGVVREVKDGLLTITDPMGDTWKVSAEAVRSAASVAPTEPPPPPSVVHRFRKGDRVWTIGVPRGWLRSVVAHVDRSGMIQDHRGWWVAPLSTHVVLRFREYRLGEHVEWNNGTDTWLPAIVIQDSPWMLGLRVRQSDGRMMATVEQLAINVRRATLATEDAESLEASTEELLCPKARLPLNACAGDVTDGSCVWIDGIDGPLEAVVIGRDGRGVRVVLGGGDHVIVPESEMLHDSHLYHPVFVCPVGCPGIAPTKFKIRFSDDGPALTVSRVIPLERAAHVDVYRCTKCGGMWHRDDLVRRRGQALVEDWAKRREVGVRLKMKIAERRTERQRVGERALRRSLDKETK